MDSEDDDFLYDDEEELSDELDDDFLGDEIDSSEPAAKRPYDDDFQYDSLTPESIVSTMNKSIEDVNSVFQVSSMDIWLARPYALTLTITSHRDTSLIGATL